MASATTRVSSSVVLTLLFFLCMPYSTTASGNVSAVFAFGDSAMDSGNNNYFGTLFRGDHLPYGRDFPKGVPTGRFSDGKISSDYLTQMLGVKDLLPAYLDPRLSDKDLLTGVSFASGGSGLDGVTAAKDKVMDLSTQFRLFEEAFQRMRNIVGDEKANNIVQNAVFVISIGTNDMLYNAYLLPLRMATYGSISGYQDFLLQNLREFIQRLHAAGARRIMVAGLPPIGCLPLQVTISSVFLGPHWLQRVCNDQQNMDSQAYNKKLQTHINSLQTSLNGAKIAYFDIYSPILDMVKNPTKYGFVQSLRGCCGTGLTEMGPGCNAFDLTCQYPSQYLFWDAVHLTQAGHYYVTLSGQKTALKYLTS